MLQPVISEALATVPVPMNALALAALGSGHHEAHGQEPSLFSFNRPLSS